MVGGISRTESNNGYRFDIGGHRFFTKVKEVEDMWHEVLTDDFITVPAPEPHLLPREILRLSAEAVQRAGQHRPL
jgi:protoporphyrinogen oxidase